MPTVMLTLPHHAYDIHIDAGLLPRLGELVRPAAPHHLAGLFADANVSATFGQTARQSLEAAGYTVAAHAVPPGEDHKNLEQVRGLYDVALDARLERRSPIIALGGGVIGDTIGFLAATYLRGVPFIQCPTTLLAMVDASVGGKVGVNVPQGKNLIGAFWQPRLVVIDVATLATLPPRELRCGLAECVKHGVIRDGELFNWIEERVDAILSLDAASLIELVDRNVKIKAAVVMADEREAGQRAHLNFGHTFAHAIEATTGYGRFHHGEAVALGMVAATTLAADLGRAPADLLDRLTALLARIGLPTRADLPPTDILLGAMRHDKKVAAGRLRLVLPDRMGAVSIVDDVDDRAIEAAWRSIRA